jgi:hypothetical protein
MITNQRVGEIRPLGSAELDAVSGGHYYEVNFGGLWQLKVQYGDATGTMTVGLDFGKQLGTTEETHFTYPNTV